MRGLSVVLLIVFVFLSVGTVARAAVQALSVIWVSPDCTQITIRVTDDGTGDNQVRSGHIDFSGAVTVPTIYVSCDPTEPNAPQCNGQGPEDEFTVAVNDGAGYDSATPITINYTAVMDSAYGVFNTSAGFPMEGTIELPACTTESSGGNWPNPTETPWARSTPTPWPTFDPNSAQAISLFSADRPGEMADTVIQGYNFLNQTGIIDVLVFAMMSILVMGLLLRFIKRSKEVGE